MGGDADAEMEDSGAPQGGTLPAGTREGESQAPGPSERALAALKPFARIAWEECREPLPEAAGSAWLRWEIYSTWTLLLCLHHAEAEAERCHRDGWQPQPWRTESEALRHVFLRSRGLRALSGVLRWLRWAHRWGPERGELEQEALKDGDASYERTRRALQLKGTLPTPLQAAPALHPDGPLQQPDMFDEADLADETQLLRRLFCALRRGDLRGALQLCADSGQPWRTALLQGMFPFADSSADGEVAASYRAMEEDDDEAALAIVKEEHTDWTEIGAIESPGCSNGNPWRRVWKEQCWNTAHRHLQQPASPMGLHELAIYGFCAGHQEALLPACREDWADRLWAELHCLKEWLVESLLEDGRKEWCGADLFLGEGDCGCLDPFDTPETRGARQKKLCGQLHGSPAPDFEAIVARHVNQILVATRASVASPFAALQASIIQAAWEPAQGDAALTMLRSWLAEGLGGAPCPFVVKQFASHFAIWQKESLEEGSAIEQRPDAPAAAPAAEAETATEEPPSSKDVDDIVCELVGDLVAAAASEWQQQCLDGQAIELIAEHVSAMSTRSRLEAFASLLLQMRPGEGEVGNASAIELRLEVLKRCVWVFWSRFPQDAFALIAVLVRKALRLDEESLAEEELPEIGLCGVRSSVVAPQVNLAILCIMVFWLVAREKAEAGESLEEALSGLELVLGSPLVDDEKPQSGDDFARLALDLTVLPLLGDVLLTLSVQEPESALATLPLLQSSALWRDAFACQSPGCQTLAELAWFLGLCERHMEWREALLCEKAQRSDPSQQAFNLSLGVRYLGAGWESSEVNKAEQQRSAAQDALLDWARPRLCQDRPLLEPQPGAHTTLPEQQMQRLCSAITCRLLLVLLSVFEGVSDFDGAMNDLVVAVAQSPWMLQRLAPRHARAFLRRLAIVPTRSSDERLGIPVVA